MYNLPKEIGKYEIGGNIGRGGFSACHLVTNNLSEKLACKIIPHIKGYLYNENIEKVYEEIKIVCKFNNENIIKIYDFIQDDNYSYIMMEYCENGNLLDYIIKKGSISESESKEIFFQILIGMKDIHSQKISHRDLKPENILLNSDYKIKICDFGFSKKNDSVLKTNCGSFFYTAPEILKKELYDGIKADIWSLGVILYAMLTGNLPWSISNSSKTLYEILNKIPEIPKKISYECHNLFKSIFQRDPQRRPSIDQLLDMDWFKNHSPRKIDLSKSVIHQNPLKSEDILFESNTKIIIHNLSIDREKKNLTEILFNFKTPKKIIIPKISQSSNLIVRKRVSIQPTIKINRSIIEKSQKII